MKNFIWLLLCCSVAPVLAGEPPPFPVQLVVIDDKPPQNPVSPEGCGAEAPP